MTLVTFQTLFYVEVGFVESVRISGSLYMFGLDR